MRKKYLSALLFGVALTAATGTFVSCKDYDDDIDNLQEQINKKASLEDLAKEVGSLRTELQACQQTCQDNLAAAKKELEDAIKEAGGDVSEALEKAGQAVADAKTAQEAAAAAEELAKAAKSVAEEAKTTALEAKANATACTCDANKIKLDAVAEAKTLVDNLDTKLTGLINGKASQADLDALEDELDAVKAQVMNIIGHRLSSIALIPTKHINGIPAIVFTTLKYTPQTYKAAPHNGSVDTHAGTAGQWLDHTGVANAKPVYLSNGLSEVQYHMSPSIGVRPSDIEVPSFDCFISENVTRAGAEIKNNSPIKPVAGQEINIKDGVLTVRYEKSADFKNTLITTTGSAHNGDQKENFWMASLKVPVAQANWTDEEKKAGNPVQVNSEYSRIEEEVLIPYLAQTAQSEKNYGGTPLVPVSNTFADELDVNGKYVHYHDSICLYNSGNDKLVDFRVVYNSEIDLKKYVTVCTTTEGNALSNHKTHGKLTPEEIAAYGLAFRFDIPATPYMQGNLKTNEQEFAQTSADPAAENYGVIKSRVYTVGDDSQSRTAIGREPIIRVRLIDTKNGNALIAQRYLKLRWVEAEIPAQTIPAVDLGAEYVSCHDMWKQLFTQDMNEKVYHQILMKTTEGDASSSSMSKSKFHEIYDVVEIEDLKKDGTSIWSTWKSKAVASADVAGILGSTKYWNYGAVIQDNPDVDDSKNTAEGTEEIENDKDVVFGYVVDEDKNTVQNNSYNILWAMTPEVVGKIDQTKGYSDFEITVNYKNSKNAYGVVKQTFKMRIQLPTQEFAYQGTYWKSGVGGGVFNVNPIVYNTKYDGQVTDAPHTTVGGTGLTDYSHIEADLVNGFIYAPTKKKPTSLAQFIKYIRGCAEVNFVFDDSRFQNYEHLAGYVVDDSKTQLFKQTTKPTAVTTDTEKGYLNGHISDKMLTDEGIIDYITDNKTTLAATINNHMSATAEENKKYLKWDYNEPLQAKQKVASSKEDCYSIIRLHEKDALNGTDPAKALVGKLVPVNLVVKYNGWNEVVVQQFEVFFIDPLKIDGNIGDNFIDAVINGSFLKVDKNFTFTDWNFYKVASTQLSTTDEKSIYSHDLFDYYAVKNIVFDTKKTTTSLTLNGNTYIHKDGVTDGNMPAGSMLKQMNWDETLSKTTATETASNPSHLAYFNENGTPVNVDYQLFVNVSVEYKWGTLTKDKMPIWVKPASGTPTGK